MSTDYERLRALAEADPEQFRRLMASVRSKTIYPHAGQKLVLDSEARFKIMNCGRRWGKTKLAAKMIVAEARKPKQMLWWVAPTYKITKRGYEEVISQLPDGILVNDPPPPSTNFDAGRPVILRFKNGSKLEFYSAERPEGMLGAGVDFVVLDEAATMPPRIWNQIVSPTLMDRKGGALLISTPRGMNWFYRVWQQGQDPQEPLWDSWTFPSDANPTLDPDEVDRMRRDLPRLEQEQEIDAKFVAAGSSTFVLPKKCIQYDQVLDNNFVEDVSVKGQHVVLGIDLARTNDYTVLYGARVSDRRNCYFERMQAVTWPEQKRRIKRAVKLLMRAGATGVTLIMDSTGVGDPIFEDIEAAGFDAVGINFTSNKNNMVNLLAKDLEVGHAFVLEDGQREEFENYQMSKTPGGRWQYSAPEGEHDDVVSAKMLQHHGLVNEGMPGITLLGPAGEEVAEEVDPWDAPDDDDIDVSDDYGLIDEGMTDAEAAEAIGLPTRLPTPSELLNQPDLWL